MLCSVAVLVCETQLSLLFSDSKEAVCNNGRSSTIFHLYHLKLHQASHLELYIADLIVQLKAVLSVRVQAALRNANGHLKSHVLKHSIEVRIGINVSCFESFWLRCVTYTNVSYTVYWPFFQPQGCCGDPWKLRPSTL